MFSEYKRGKKRARELKNVPETFRRQKKARALSGREPQGYLPTNRSVTPGKDLWMPILNYTTQVESGKSIAEITSILSNFGARTITTDYDENGFVSGIAFVVMVEGLPLAIRLPVNVEGVYKNLCHAKGVPNSKRTREQARRVAWRILKDWLEAQLALFQVGQAEMAQVLMPYAIDAEGRSAYQAFRDAHMKQLNAAPDNVVEGRFIASGE